MRLLVDEMPDWRGDCPFAEDKWINGEWGYTCKLCYQLHCDLNEIENECRMLKKIKLKDYTNEN